MGEGLVLPQFKVPDIVNSSWESLPVRGVDWEGVEGRQEEGWEGELWVECKVTFKK